MEKRAAANRPLSLPPLRLLCHPERRGEPSLSLAPPLTPIIPSAADSATPPGRVERNRRICICRCPSHLPLPLAFALRLTPYALRLTPYALRLCLTPCAVILSVAKHPSSRENSPRSVSSTCPRRSLALQNQNRPLSLTPPPLLSSRAAPRPAVEGSIFHSLPRHPASLRTPAEQNKFHEHPNGPLRRIIGI